MNYNYRMKKYILICIVAILLLAGLYFFITDWHAKELDTWTGRYSCFTIIESKDSEQGIFADFEIIIFKINRNYYAKLSGDGWMLLTRSLACVKGDKNSIDIIFMDTLPQDKLYAMDRYEEGELLLTLSYVDSKLHTTWHALKIENPSLSGMEGELEGIYFEKD